MDTSDPDTRLALFLRDLADKIDNKNISPRRLQNVGEFYMAYQFQEQARRDMHEPLRNRSEFTQEELIKFIICGWYIYHLLENM